MKTTCLAALLALSTLAGPLAAQVVIPTSDSRAALAAAARAEGKVVIYSVLSNRAAQPLLDDFRALYPGIEVAYDGERGSNETPL